MNLPRIVLLTTSYPTHSNDWSGVFIAKLAEALKEKGYRILVICPAVPGGHGRYPVNGIDTVRFGYFFPRSLERLTGGEGGIPENLSSSVLARIQLMPMMGRFFQEVLRETRPSDVVYANWLGAALVGASVCSIRKAPLVVSLRGDDGYLARDKPVWRILTKWVIRKSAFLAPVSKELLQIVMDLGAAPSKCSLPRFGVDTDLFYPACEHNLSEEKVCVVFVGSLVQKKGLQDLFIALSAPELRQIELTVVGDGSYRGRLKALCHELALDERTRWRGVVSPREVASILRESDVLCLPSYTEGSPNVIKEAMASGLPVVATRVGGIPDLVSHEQTGLLYEPGDVEGLKKCLVSLVQNHEMRERFGDEARRIITEGALSWDTTAEDFDVIFRKCVSEKPYHD